MGIKKWLKNNATDLSGKNIIIIGATGGLGQELCLILASLNANLTLACRNKSKADALRQSILKEHSNVNINLLELDLGSLQSVDSFINHVKNMDFDVLICNAGIYNVPIKKMDSGFNNVFQTNFLAQYIIIKQLLSTLRKREDSKVVVVGSIAHNYSKIDVKDIDFTTYKKPSKIYGNSKRFLMFSLYELFKNEKVGLSVIHPGITLTNMTNHYPKCINWLVKIGIKLLFPSPKKACLNYIYGIFNNTEYHEWIGPKIFNIWGKPKKSKLRTCSIQESEEIFKISENLFSMIS